MPKVENQNKSEKRSMMKDSKGRVVLYKNLLEVRLKQDTVWLSLNQLADLFERDKSVISRHLRNVFDEQELNRHSVVAKFATTAADGKTYQVEHFNLDVIISSGSATGNGSDRRLELELCASWGTWGKAEIGKAESRNGA